jgi:hypothetical protein
MISLGIEVSRNVATDTTPALLDARIRLKQTSEVQRVAQQGQHQQLA